MSENLKTLLQQALDMLEEQALHIEAPMLPAGEGLLNRIRAAISQQAEPAPAQDEREAPEVVAYRISRPGQAWKVYEQRQDWAYQSYGHIRYEVQDLMTVAQHERTLSAVTAERDRLRKDAERYRWLRGRLPGSAYRIAGVIYSEGGDGVDAAIDAAMAAKEA